MKMWSNNHNSFEKYHNMNRCFGKCKMEWSPRPRRGPTIIFSMWTLILGCINMSGLRPGQSVIAEPLDVVKVSAVAGGDATLPCDTQYTRASPSDVLLLVVWYKNNVPLYSYDGRIDGPSAHWSDDVLGGRARWLSATPSSLHMSNVLPTDRATYRCRIDYKISPTKNHKILLDVIELPEKPKIFDELDKEVIGITSPYVEDSSIKLTCVVGGGKPMPQLRWWRDDKVIASLAPVEDGSRLSVLELKIAKLTRDYFEAVYTCTADNTALVPPLKVNVQIQMYLRPLSVEMLNREQPLVVGQAAELACKSVGARPPAVITWWLDDEEMPAASSVQEDSDDKNETISYLRWIPRMDQHERVLACRAAHLKLEHITIEYNIKLDLYYSPTVNLLLGSGLNPFDIEEGDDVYFECIVDANPPPYKVIWEHDGQAITHNQRAGVIVGASHLALQRVNKRQAGQYSCTASNVEGDGISPPMNLQIIYKPVCISAATVIVGTAINEPTKVICEVDAFPEPKNFLWTLNNSMGTSQIETGKFTIEATGRSVLSYIPATEKDYGSLTCKATNLAGQQVEPCRFSLLPAVRPDRLTNCVSVNLTEDSAEIKCDAGYDGGLKTSFHVEVWTAKNLVANFSTRSPAWLLRGLGSGKTFKLVFYANNARGRSQPTTMRIHTLSRLVLKTDAKSESSPWKLGIIAAIAGILITTVIIIFLIRKRQQPTIEYEAPMQPVKTYKDRVHSADHSPGQPDDKNPDVVPLDSKDFNSAQDLERLPEPPPYGSVVSPLVGASRSSHSLNHHDVKPIASRTPVTPASDSHSIGSIADDRRSLTGGNTSRRREIVTTRTPLLSSSKESRV